MFAAPTNGMPASTRHGDMGRACQVSLIDRRTGQAHRVGGRAVVLFIRDPQAAVRQLLDGRDARLWEARVEPLDPFEAA